MINRYLRKLTAFKIKYIYPIMCKYYEDFLVPYIYGIEFYNKKEHAEMLHQIKSIAVCHDGVQLHDWIYFVIIPDVDNHGLEPLLDGYDYYIDDVTDEHLDGEDCILTVKQFNKYKLQNLLLAYMSQSKTYHNKMDTIK